MCIRDREKVAGAVTGATAPLNNSEQVIRRVQESMENLAKSTEKYKNIGKLPINDFSGGLAEANAPADQVDKTIQRVRDGTEQARKSTEKYGKAAKSEMCIRDRISACCSRISAMMGFWQYRHAVMIILPCYLAYPI